MDIAWAFMIAPWVVGKKVKEVGCNKQAEYSQCTFEENRGRYQGCSTLGHGAVQNSEQPGIPAHLQVRCRYRMCPILV